MNRDIKANNDFDRKLRYMITMFEAYVEDLVWDVIYDDKDDPEKSAVAAANCIKSIICVKQHFNLDCEYLDQTSFILSKGLSPEQADEFEKLRRREAEYYEGVQF